MPPSPSKPPEGQRIAKLLARAGIASRREVERMIAEGRVALNGVLLDTPATILSSLSGITVDGQPVAAAEPTRLFAFHKPIGCLTTEYDPEGRPTIYDHLPGELPRVIPVGRLDMNTEGLLLLTTDGELKRQLELPATGVERSYRARAYGDVTQEQLEALMLGIEIEGMHYGPIDANLERRTGANAWIEMTLTEGKNREVRRVLEHLGLEVSRLIRTRYGPFLLDDLPVGGVAEIRQHDLVAFRKSLELPADRRRALRSEPGVRIEKARPQPAAAVEPEGNLRKNPRTRPPGDAPPAASRSKPKAEEPRKPIGFGARQRARFKPRDEASRPGPVARAGARIRPKGEALETRRPDARSERASPRSEGSDRPPRSGRRPPNRQRDGEHPDYDPRTARGDGRAPWDGGAGRTRRDGDEPSVDRARRGSKPLRVNANRPSRANRDDGLLAEKPAGKRPPRADNPKREGWARAKPRPTSGPRKGGPRK